MSKIPLILIDKGYDLIKQVIPPINQIYTNIGATNIGKENFKLPDVCLQKEELEKILKIRNEILGVLKKDTNYIQTLNQPVDILKSNTEISSSTLETLNIISTTTNLAMAAIPSPIPGVPGAIPSSINVVNKIINKLEPIINNTKNKVTTIIAAIGFINGILFNIIKLLESIDIYLIGCNIKENELEPLNEYLINVKETYKNISKDIDRVYQGFNLDIIEEQYSPTVKRIKAVAKNPQGIILLQTPYSFTTIPQILIDELKIIIDKNNLKAY